MAVINVAEQFGPICVTTDEGAVLCALAAESMHRGESVHLDFRRVSTLATRFLNPAIGCLYASFRPDVIDELLTWEGLDEVDTNVLRLIQRNAIRYFSSTEDQQSRLIEAADHNVRLAQ